MTQQPNHQTPTNKPKHVDTCDDCGRRLLLESPRAIRQCVLCDDCWSAQEYDPASDPNVF